jgi:hypothetical protein
MSHCAGCAAFISASKKLEILAITEALHHCRDLFPTLVNPALLDSPLGP